MKLKKISSNHLQLFYLLLLGISFLGIFYFCFNSKIFLGGDNVYYYNLGKALAEGKGYVTYNLPHMPTASHYPPGYPAIVALAMILVSKSIIVIKILNGIFLLGSTVLLFFLFKDFSDNIHLAFIGALIIILNPVMLTYGSIMMSEIPFLFFTCLTLLLYIKSNNKKSPYTQLSFYVFILALTISFHIKTLGIALIGSFILYFLINKKWQWAISTLTGFTVLALPWGIRNFSVGGSSYIHQLMMVNPYRPELGKVGIEDLLLRFFKNVKEYITIEIPAGLFPFLKDFIPAYSILGWIVGSAIVLVVIFGFLQLKRRSSLIAIYIFATFGILLLWPNVWTDVRFLIAILPFLIFAFLAGVYELLIIPFQRINYAKYLHPTYLLILAIYFIPDLAKLHEKNQQPYPQNWAAYIEMAKWTGNNTASDAIISCRKPAIFNLFSDRKTFRFKDTPDHAVLIDDLKKNDTDYVVLDQLGFYSTKHYLFPALKKYENHFKVSLRTTGVKSYLLKFQPDSSSHD